jgi:hypothetical protein
MISIRKVKVIRQVHLLFFEVRINRSAYPFWVASPISAMLIGTRAAWSRSV